MDEVESISFDKRMRAATREIHSISDALVNAKLAFALSNSEVWSEGLVVFYEVFRFLEEAVDRHKGSLMEQVFIDDMRRTEAFERDLDFYLGADWKETYKIRGSVASYLKHLKQMEESDPKILIAYIYHLYMGLASGGQVLRYKRSMSNKFCLSAPQTSGGDSVTDFGSVSLSTLKRQLRDNVNTVAEQLSEDDKTKLIQESKTVFLLNNEIIRSVKSADYVFRRKIMSVMFLIIFIVFIYLSIF